MAPGDLVGMLCLGPWPAVLVLSGPHPRHWLGAQRAWMCVPALPQIVGHLQEACT